MYFKITKKKFHNALTIVSHAISAFSPLPVFSGIKIDAQIDSLILTSSDSDVSIQTKISMNEDSVLRIHDMGSTIIEAKYILEIVRKIDADEIEFENIDSTTIKITGNTVKFKLNSMRVNEYPIIDFSKPKENFIINTEELRNIILQTSFATSDKETRPALTGVNFHCLDNILNCVATDSYRLSKKSIEIENHLNFNVTIPAKSLLEVLKTLVDDGNVEIAVNDKKAQFYLNNTIIQTRLIDGVFPETDRLIPLAYDYELTIDAKDLLNAIDRASFIKKDGISVIKFTLSKNECVLTSNSIEVGSSTEILNSASFVGDDLEINCNGRFVFEAIKALSGSVVKFRLCGEMKPFIIQSLDNESVIQLVLPVKTYA